MGTNRLKQIIIFSKLCVYHENFNRFETNKCLSGHFIYLIIWILFLVIKGRPWHTYEGFTIIIREQVKALIKLGASPLLKVCNKQNVDFFLMCSSIQQHFVKIIYRNHWKLMNLFRSYWYIWQPLPMKNLHSQYFRPDWSWLQLHNSTVTNSFKLLMWRD